jgi:hypothetical protein
VNREIVPELIPMKKMLKNERRSKVGRLAYAKIRLGIA